MKDISVSLFHQILDLISKREFEEIVMKYDGDKQKQAFDNWAHFVPMIFCQPHYANSSREICDGLRISGEKLSHLREEGASSKSNLSCSNQHWNPEIFKGFFFTRLKCCKEIVLQHEFLFKRKLYSLDATLIELCVRAFPWISYHPIEKNIKLDMLLYHDVYLPVFLDFTYDAVHEVACTRNLTRYSMVAYDRGYVDYAMFYKWNLGDINFVTRLKSNATYIIPEYDLTRYSDNTLNDVVIYLYGSCGKSPKRLLEVVVSGVVNHKTLVPLTNNFDLACRTIADIYKSRWQIDFFSRCSNKILRSRVLSGPVKCGQNTDWDNVYFHSDDKIFKFFSKAEWHCEMMFLKWNFFGLSNLWQWLDQHFTKLLNSESFQPEFSF